MKKSIVFLGSKPIGYYCFNYLLENKDSLQIEIIGLLTNENKQYSQEFSLTTLAIENKIPILTGLHQLPEADILYSVQYHEILKQQHIAKAHQLAVNLHMAPLPEYRGCNQFSFAILDNKKVFGTTIHQLDTGIDSGAILFEKRFSIPENCWVNELYQLTEQASKILFIETINDIILNNIKPIAQQNLVAERGTCLHFRYEINKLKQLQKSWSQEKINKHIRATYMPNFEPPYFFIEGKKEFIKVQK